MWGGGAEVPNHQKLFGQWYVSQWGRSKNWHSEGSRCEEEGGPEPLETPPPATPWTIFKEPKYKPESPNETIPLTFFVSVFFHLSTLLALILVTESFRSWNLLSMP